MPRQLYVVATDLSRPSRDAMSWALELARRTQAEVDLFCAVPAHLATAGNEILERARTQLDDWARRAADDGVTTECHVTVVKDVPEAIVAHANEHDATFVVVGPSGVSGWKKLVLGSVTEQVLRLTPSVTLVARGACTAVPKRILVALDRSAGADRAFRMTVDLARSIGASVTAIHVVPPPGAWLALAGEPYLSEAVARDEERLRIARHAFEGWIARFEHDGVSVDVKVVEGDAVTEILAAAKAGAADLVVTGTHGKTPLHEFFVGSVARSVAAKHTGSVLLIRARPPKRAGRRPLPKLVAAPGGKGAAGEKRPSRRPPAK